MIFTPEPTVAALRMEAAILGWAAVAVYAVCLIAAAVVVSVLLTEARGRRV